MPLDTEHRNRNRLSLDFSVAASGFAFSPDSRVLALSTPDGLLGLHDLATGRVRKKLSAGIAPDVVCFHPKGSMLTVWGKSSADVHILSSETGELLCRLPHAELMQRGY